MHFKIIDEKKKKIEGVEKESKSWEKLNNYLFLEIYHSFNNK